MRLGIFGGAFDPIHIGHLVLAQEAYDQLDLDKVLFVPAYNPAKRAMAHSYSHRYHMVMNAIAPRMAENQFELSDIEERFRVRYTSDMLEHVREEFRFMDSECYLLIGADQAAKFFDWHSPLTILTQVHQVVAATRSLHKMAPIAVEWGSYWQKHLRMLTIPPLEISSTLIRERVRDGKSIRYLVPDAVRAYILSEGLYR